MKHAKTFVEGFDGLKLFSQHWLPDDAPKAVLALTHGVGEHSSRYPTLVNALTAAGVAVYAYDQRGHGRSEGARGAVNNWSDLRRDCALHWQRTRAAQPDLPLFAMGHSMGGLVVAEALLRLKPDGLRGVILSAPALGQTAVSPLLVMAARVLNKVAPRTPLQSGLDVNAISRDPAAVRAYSVDALNHGVITPRLGMEMLAAQAFCNAHAAQFAYPLLVLHGEADAIVPERFSAAFFNAATSSDKTRIVYPGGFHEPHNDTQRAQVVADVADWLMAHTKTPLP